MGSEWYLVACASGCVPRLPTSPGSTFFRTKSSTLTVKGNRCCVCSSHSNNHRPGFDRNVAEVQQLERLWITLYWSAVTFCAPAVLSFQQQTWFGEKREPCFSSSSQRRFVIGGFPLSRARISCLCPNEYTDLWMKSRFLLWANRNPGGRAPSNRRRGLRFSSQSAPDRLRAFILDFPVVFHSQKKTQRGKVRGKKNSHS